MENETRHIAILGSTGSIDKQAREKIAQALKTQIVALFGSCSSDQCGLEEISYQNGDFTYGTVTRKSEIPK